MKNQTFLTSDQARSICEQWGTPVYIYDLKKLRSQAEAALRFPNAFGLTVRYAMKASPNAAILQILDAIGLHFDASSGYEVERAIRAGIDPRKISLSTQEMPGNFRALFEQGIHFNACSLNQLERFGEQFPGQEVGIRFNPGLGSGATSKTNVGGPASSFGIWHESAERVEALLKRYHLKGVRIHTHIGSGSNPRVWQKVAQLSLSLVQRFPEVVTLNLGGGFKIDRMNDAHSTNLQLVGTPIRTAFKTLAEATGRKVHLEIEPGTYLMANSCALLASIQDKVSTGPNGFEFLKLDTGMTEILRPCLYGAQHPLLVFPSEDTTAVASYVVVGHCCESGDLLTPDPNEHSTLKPRKLTKAKIGDLCLIGGTGAYCSSMSVKNYNSFPEAAEIILDEEGNPHLIRKRQTLDQIIQNEIFFNSR